MGGLNINVSTVDIQGNTCVNSTLDITGETCITNNLDATGIVLGGHVDTGEKLSVSAFEAELIFTGGPWSTNTPILFQTVGSTVYITLDAFYVANINFPNNNQTPVLFLNMTDPKYDPFVPSSPQVETNVSEQTRAAVTSVPFGKMIVANAGGSFPVRGLYLQNSTFGFFTGDFIVVNSFYFI